LDVFYTHTLFLGNIGLQASASTLRALATGHATNSSLRDALQAMFKEFFTAITIATLAGIFLCGIAAEWGSSLKFGLVTGSR